jgi:hypothetical protein
MKGEVSVRLELDCKEVEKIIEDIKKLAERLSEAFPFNYPGLAALRELLLELDLT